MRLDGERDTLGLYLTGHPFEEFENEVKPIVSGRIADVTGDRPVVTNEGFRFQGKPATVAGMVFDLGKRGSRIIFTLDDRSGRLEASMFEEQYQQYRALIAKSAILIVEGSLRFDEFIEGWRLNCQTRHRHRSGARAACAATADSLAEGRRQFVSRKRSNKRCGRSAAANAPSRFAITTPQRGPTSCCRRNGACSPTRELTERLSQIVGNDGYARRVCSAI